MPPRPSHIVPRWLKLKDAAAYSALGEKRLVSLAEDGTIKGFKDPDSGRRDWIFDRDTLDAYREGQAAEEISTPVRARCNELIHQMRRKA